MSSFDHSVIQSYIARFYKETDPFFLKLEAYASEHSVPIMEKPGLVTMLHYLTMLQPRKVLEIGTAIGYSATKMAVACTNSHIVTIERDPVRVEEATAFITEKGFSDRITILAGDALDLQAKITEKGPFDALFIDAAKGQYQSFFEMYAQLVQEGGLIFSDNVLFKGWVADSTHINQKRTQSIVEKIRRYNDWLMAQPSYDTILLPIGDGLAVSRKLEERGRTIEEV